jgi:hypothetical protein
VAELIVFQEIGALPGQPSSPVSLKDHRKDNMGNEFYFRGGIYCNLHESELKIASREVLQYRETSLFNQDGTDDLAVIGRECLIKKVKTRWSKVRIK